MNDFLQVMVPLAVLCLGLGVLLTGRIGQFLVIAGTVLAGVAVVLALLPA